MTQKFGFVAIVGRPNVGKSTLLNHILGFKLSITSRKPQTTRHRVLGIWTEDQVQIAFVDTPGMHTDQPKAMNRMMNQTAEQALSGVDAVVMLTDGRIWNELDERVYQKVKRSSCPTYWVINKSISWSKKVNFTRMFNPLSLTIPLMRFSRYRR